MIKKLKKLLTTASLATLLLAPATMSVATVYAATDDVSGGIACGVDLSTSGVTAGTSTCTQPDVTAAGGRVDQIIKLVINVFSLIVGVVSVIMIIIGGLKYITSGGDSGNITGAKNTILYAIIGLVVVALAQVVVKFVLAKATE